MDECHLGAGARVREFLYNFVLNKTKDVHLRASVQIELVLVECKRGDTLLGVDFARDFAPRIKDESTVLSSRDQLFLAIHQPNYLLSFLIVKPHFLVRIATTLQIH